MRNYIKLFFVLPLIYFSSCSTAEEDKMLMNISGSPGEVVVVATSTQWDGLIGETVRKHFEAPVYGMPQKEPLFNVVRTDQEDFERIFKTFRNVVILDIDTNRFSEGKISYHKNAWARGQLIIKITASSRDEIIEVFNHNAQKIIYAIQIKEFNRLYAKYKAKPNKSINQKLINQLQLDVTVPKIAAIASSDSVHAWVRIEREKLKGGYEHQISQGLVIYKYPYTAKQQFLDSNLFTLRDSVLKKYITGPREGTYMTTEYRYTPPVSKEIEFDGHFAKEIHGLWRMENDFMGGPMATYFVLNEDEGMIYCISGYAFAPQFDKREYYREIEAIARSVRFVME